MSARVKAGDSESNRPFDIDDGLCQVLIAFDQVAYGQAVKPAWYIGVEGVNEWQYPVLVGLVVGYPLPANSHT